MEQVVGYGFHPTNEQLVGHYLRKKRLNPDYSHPKITELNINDHEPSELLGESDASERYLFVPPRYTNTKRKLVKRRTRGGTWKATGKIPDIKDKRSKKVIGSKRKLVFYQGPSTGNKNARTNYVMDELHCNPDPLFKADFVVVRIKIKPNDSCDSSTTSESVTSHQPTSDSGDHIAEEVSQVESQQLPNNDMSCNSEDYRADIMFSKDSQPLQNHDISPDRILDRLSQSLSYHDISPNIISQPPSHHHLSLNREPDLLPNQDISFNQENQPLPLDVTSFNREVHDTSFNREVQPLPFDITSFNREVQPLPLDITSFNREVQPLPFDITSFNREVQPLPFDITSFNREVQPLPLDITSFNREVQPLSFNVTSFNREVQPLPLDITSFNREFQPLPLDITSFNREVQPLSNYNLPSILPHHEISTNREFQPLNYDISFNREYQTLLHDISSNGESHVVPNYNLSSISPHQDISSNRESQPLLDHSLYPNIEELVRKNTSTEVEPLDLAVWDSVIAYYGLDCNSFYTQQTQIHQQQQQMQIHQRQQQKVWDSLIDYNGQDQNSFSAQQTQSHLQQGSSHSCDSSDDSNVLNTPLGSEQENNWSNLQRDVQFSEKETGHSHTPDFHSTKPATGAAYVYGSSDESALLNGDSTVSNSPLGSEHENNWSNLQRDVQFSEKETGHSHTPDFHSTKPVTGAAYVYGSSDESALLNGDSTVSNSPLGSEQENNWSNLQRDVQFSKKETGHSHTPDFHSTKPATGAAYVYSSSDESALLNGDSTVSNSPLGSEQENNWSNSQWGVQDEFYSKEPVHPPPPDFNLSMPVTEAYASHISLYTDAMLIDDPLLYGFSPMTYGENGFNSTC